jgi:hypothetical protein
MIQVIPVDLFAGFTRFPRVGILLTIAAFKVCIPGTERNACEEEWRRFCRIKVIRGNKRGLLRWNAPGEVN